MTYIRGLTYVPSQRAYNEIVEFLNKGETVSAIGFVHLDGKMTVKEAKAWVDAFMLHYLAMKDILE